MHVLPWFSLPFQWLSNHHKAEQHNGMRVVDMHFAGEVDNPSGHIQSSRHGTASNLHSLNVKVTGDLLPAVNDPETVLNFAKMSANSYKRRSMDGWRNMTGDYTGLDGFGWSGNGLRGHIYANAAQSLVIIGFKGTSTLLMGGGTVAMDKYVDNLMFSCCCARIDISWIPVCGCYLGGVGTEEKEGNSNYAPVIEDETAVRTSSGRCNQTCLLESVRNEDDLYYWQAVKIVKRVKENYPHARLWFTGHSLGGAIASLMAVTFPDTAAVTFEAPGDILYARRIGLSSALSTKRSTLPIYNFGITTDPVFMGTCQGPSTSCYLSGYAMETKCRHGHDCTIDLGPDRAFDVTTHRIDWVIDNVLQGQYRMPQCRPVEKCTDCDGWVFE